MDSESKTVKKRPKRRVRTFIFLLLVCVYISRAPSYNKDALLLFGFYSTVSTTPALPRPRQSSFDENVRFRVAAAAVVIHTKYIHNNTRGGS